MKILVSIPCYNCEKQIQRALEKIASHQIPGNVDFLIVENNSTDQTKNVIHSVLKNFSPELRQRFIVFHHVQNYGLGGSFKTIFEHARVNHYEHVVLFHGDDQATAGDLLLFINEVLENDPDFLLGARFMPGSKLHGYSSERKFGNIILNYIFSIVLRKKIHDIGSGLNSYRLQSLIEAQVPLFPNHIAFDAILLLHFMEGNYRGKFIPIEWHEKDQVSNARNFSVAFEVLLMLVKHKFGRRNLLESKIEGQYEVYVP